MRHRVFIVAAVCLVLIVLAGIAATGPQADLSKDVQILIEDAAQGSICVTNHGKKILAAAVSFQVYSNGMWHPPKEGLFGHPWFVLTAAGSDIPKRIQNAEAGPSVRYNFSEIARQEAPWRVVVLCQKYYASTLMGQIKYVFARCVTQRASFSDADRRGPYDVWLYSEAISTTNQISRDHARQ